MNRNAQVIDVHNPYTGQKLGSVTSASKPDVEQAVGRARQAFEADECLPIDRRNMLFRARELLGGRREEFARMIASETGKPIRESRVEVDRACTTILWSAEESLRLEGMIHHCGVTAQRLAKRAFVERIPLGVVAAVVPFNFPLNIPAHKMGPALAAGNAVIVKPSPKAPMATERLVELFHEAGVDAGMLQVLHGGADVVEGLARGHVNVMSFTGSTRVGRQVAEWAAGKKVVMELGGNDPIVVMDDADLDQAAKVIVAHRFGSSGQRCTSCKRAFLHAAVYDDMKERLLRGVANLVVGDPLEEATDIGPLIDEEAAERVMAKLEAAVQDGAKVLCGGTRDGAVVEPTLVENVKPSHALFHEETFGPVLPLVAFESFDEVVAGVNSTPYGLQSGIFTNRMDVIQEAFRRFEVGAVVVNDGPGLRVEPIPFGGVKGSGLGREGIRYAMEEFTTLKTLVL